MAKFFSSMVNSVSSALSKNIDPNQVREVGAGQYAVQPVRRREECLLLYCPAPAAAGQEGRIASVGDAAMAFSKEGASVSVEAGPPYEVVVQSERNVNYCYSLFRSRDVSEAEARFEAYLQTVPAFLACRPELAATGSLQKLIDCVREHPLWSLAHLAVSLDMMDLLTVPTFRSTIDVADGEAVTPLMLAVSLGSKHLTAAVLAAGGSVQGADKAGRTVFHHAARATSLPVIDILVGFAAEALKEEPDLLPRLLDQADGEGQTALHLACRGDRPDLVKALLCAGADLNTLASQDGGARPRAAAGPGEVRALLEQYPAHVNSKELRLRVYCSRIKTQ